MADPALVESFVRRWQPAIIAALSSLSEAVRIAGYATADPVDDIDPGGPVPRLMWIMHTMYPGRPEELSSMDVFITFSLLPADDEGTMFVPAIELLNVEGSFADDIELGQTIRLDDDRAMAAAVQEAHEIDEQVITLLEAYYPKPLKQIWKIKTTSPEGKPFNPSVHSKEEVAKEETYGLLHLSLDKIYHLFWELDAVKMVPGGSSAALYDLRIVNMLLEDGKVWQGLRSYHDFLRNLPRRLRDRVTKEVGTIEVETTGGFE